MKLDPKEAFAHERSRHGFRASRCNGLMRATAICGIRESQFFHLFVSPTLWGQQGGEKQQDGDTTQGLEIHRPADPAGTLNIF